MISNKCREREREHDKATINVTSVQWIFPLFTLSSQRIAGFAFFRFFATDAVSFFRFVLVIFTGKPCA